jgi:GntR family transcriptional regulator
VKLDPTNGVPFYRQVETALAERIRLGDLPAGAMLPSVRGLAQELLVSVITVKQAYEALEADGLVYSAQGRGTFVAADGAAAASRRVRRALVEAVTAAVADARVAGVPEAELRTLLLSTLEPR